MKFTSEQLNKFMDAEISRIKNKSYNLYDRESFIDTMDEHNVKFEVGSKNDVVYFEIWKD